MLPNSWFLPFGLDKLFKSLAAEKQRKLPVLSLEEHEKYGDTYAQYAGGLFTILTRDPRNIAALLTKQFPKFGYGPIRHNCFAPLLGDGIFTLDGSAWEHSRKLLAPIFHKPNFPAFETIEGHVQDLFSAIEANDDMNHIDLRPLIYDFTLDTATDFFLGKSTHLLKSRSESPSVPKPYDLGSTFSSAFNTAVSWTATRERFKAFYWLVNPREFRSSCSSARHSLKNMILDGIIHSRDIQHSALNDILSKLELNIYRARDELINLIFAGRDSNASLLCWVVYALAREPIIYSRLRKEVIAKLGQRQPTKKEINEMEYLDFVVHETLRLFPAVPINGRLCLGGDTTLPVGGGEDGEKPVYVPRGTLICFSTYGTHRSKKLYGEDVGEFKPERWKVKGVRERGLDYSYHPFSAGPRRCLGENYALMLTKYTVCRFVQRFEGVTSVEDEGSDWQGRIRYQIGLTMAPDDGVVVNLRP
ncbi:cytochrome P450 52A11 [Podospora fimiseda]|uniref:Cytochrome P450 52A11 n=1 Tax=Podospora fimiseda TaxID=252190 RepID=A0AAN7BJM4_9PEZI|nr:cytochrome P450 52A11 [Podospora fimiseda]